MEPLPLQPELEKWVEPEVQVLDISETNAFRHKGNDHTRKYADSTRS